MLPALPCPSLSNLPIPPPSPPVALCSTCAGVYGEGEFRHDRAYPYVALLNNFTQMWALYCLVLCAFAQAVSHKVRTHKRLALALQRVAGLFLVAFGLRLARD